MSLPLQFSNTLVGKTMQQLRENAVEKLLILVQQPESTSDATEFRTILYFVPDFGITYEMIADHIATLGYTRTTANTIRSWMADETTLRGGTPERKVVIDYIVQELAMKLAPELPDHAA